MMATNENGKEELRSGKPPEEIEDQSTPVKEHEPGELADQATGTHGGEPGTGLRGRPPVGKGNLGR